MGARRSQKAQWLMRSHDREVYIGGGISTAYLELRCTVKLDVYGDPGPAPDPLWQRGVSDAILCKVRRLEFTSTNSEAQLLLEAGIISTVVELSWQSWKITTVCRMIARWSRNFEEKLTNCFSSLSIIIYLHSLLLQPRCFTVKPREPILR